MASGQVDGSLNGELLKDQSLGPVIEGNISLVARGRRSYHQFKDEKSGAQRAGNVICIQQRLVVKRIKGCQGHWPGTGTSFKLNRFHPGSTCVP